MKLDVSNLEEIETTLATLDSQIKRIDILINNAGISQRSLFLESKWAVMDQIMQTNFFGLVKTSHIVLKKWMQPHKSGTVVNISSLAGKVGAPLRTAYCSSKFALQGFSSSLREELRTEGIDVTVVCPGFIKTNVGSNALSSEG